MILREELMKTILNTILTGCACAAFLMAQTTGYTVADLGAVGAAGQPFYVTSNGLVSGAAAAANGHGYRAVFWYRGIKNELGTFGGPNSTAYGVNVWGQIVGWAETSDTDPNGEDFCGFGSHHVCLPFVSLFGLMIPLPTLGGKNGTANAINSRGQAAGFAETSRFDSTCPAPQKLQFKPVVWSFGGARELPTVGGDAEGIAYSINESGQVVGASGACAAFNPISLVSLQPLHALLWDANGSVTDLGNLGGTGHGQGISASAINNQGHVVGASDLPGDRTFHAYLWTKATGMQDLGTLLGDAASAAIGINDAGDIVGVSLDDSFTPRAFVRQSGVMRDLNSMVPANTPLHLLTACSINARGEIIGIAVTKDGDVHGYMATPSK